MITQTKTKEIVAKFGRDAKDTGHSAVQVALLTERIQSISGHLKTHRKDYTSQVGLLKLVGTRKRLLSYLKSSEPETHLKLLKELDLRK